VTDRLDYTLSALRRAAEIGYPFDVLPDEAAALVAEVDRLREECHTLRLWTEEAAAAENANAEDAKRERAAVVAWLLERADRVWHADAERAIVREAYAIERGEHRREEER
jgi:hypothetical protein